MLRYPMDIPCRVCGAAVDEPCHYTNLKLSRYGQQMPGYHEVRKYVDFPAARDVAKALLDA